jgi:hypothetical protein
MKMEIIVKEWLAEAPIQVEALKALRGMLKANEPCPANLFLAFPGNPGFDARLRVVIGTALSVATDSYVSGIVADTRIAEHHGNRDNLDAVKFLWLAMSNPLTLDTDTWQREFSHWSNRLSTRPGLANTAMLAIVGSPWLSPGECTHPEELLLKAAPADIGMCYQDTHRFLSGRLINAPRAKIIR